MKLTAELLAQSESALNTLQDRELDLRGLRIPLIENLGVTRDQVDYLDLTDNDVRYLGNFPQLRRLRHINLSNNSVARIDPRIHRMLPFLQTLVLTNNALAEFPQLAHLRRLRRLEYLTLMGNPVSRQKNYREFVIWRVPSVRVLDYKRVTDKVRRPNSTPRLTMEERAHARQLFETADGRPSELAVQMAGSSAAGHGPSRAAHSFEPGTLPGAAGRLLSSQEREAIEQAIEKSQSLDEIRRLEERLKLGYTVE